MTINEDFTRNSKLADIGRWFITRFVRETARSLPPGTAVLDAGAGECVYKRFFSHCDYRSVDFAVGDAAWNYGNLDYVAPLDDLPMPEGSFDAVLCTQVLEHLERPRESVRELYRVLKPGGRLFLTAPMSHNEHQEPYDFFRYTSYGLRSICAEAGFRRIELFPFGGMFTRWAYELPRALQVFPGTGLRAGSPDAAGILLLPLRVMSLLAVRGAQSALLLADRLYRIPNDPFGWAVIAEKTSSAGERSA